MENNYKKNKGRNMSSGRGVRRNKVQNQEKTERFSVQVGVSILLTVIMLVTCVSNFTFTKKMKERLSYAFSTDMSTEGFDSLAQGGVKIIKSTGGKIKDVFNKSDKPLKESGKPALQTLPESTSDNEPDIKLDSESDKPSENLKNQQPPEVILPEEKLR